MQANKVLIWAIGVLLAAVAVGLLHGLLGLFNPLLGSAYFDVLFAFAFAAALAHALILGVPVALFYRSRGWTNLIGVLIGGFFIGVLPYLLIALIVLSPGAWSDFELIGMFGGYGAFGALVFWLTLRLSGALNVEHKVAG